jgi:hypothetical protein
MPGADPEKLKIPDFEGTPEHWPDWLTRVSLQLASVGSWLVTFIDPNNAAPGALNNAQATQCGIILGKMVLCLKGASISVMQQVERAGHAGALKLRHLWIELHRKYTVVSRTMRLTAIRTLFFAQYSAQKYGCFADFRRKQEAIWHNQLQGNITADEVMILATIAACSGTFPAVVNPMLAQDNLVLTTAQRTIEEHELAQRAVAPEQNEHAHAAQGQQHMQQKKQKPPRCMACGEKGHLPQHCTDADAKAAFDAGNIKAFKAGKKAAAQWANSGGNGGGNKGGKKGGGGKKGKGKGKGKSWKQVWKYT